MLSVIVYILVMLAQSVPVGDPLVLRTPDGCAEFGQSLIDAVNKTEPGHAAVLSFRCDKAIALEWIK
jgi:hypothetical protein